MARKKVEKKDCGGRYNPLGPERRSLDSDPVRALASALAARAKLLAEREAREASPPPPAEERDPCQQGVKRLRLK